MKKDLTYKAAGLIVESIDNYISSNVYDWLKEKVFEISYIYFQKLGKDNYLGYCSCGEDDIPLQKPKSGKYTICPKCSRKVLCKNIIHSHTQEDRKMVSLIDKEANGWVQRLFISYKITKYNSETSPRMQEQYYLYEEQRDLLTYQNNIYKYHPYKKWDWEKQQYSKEKWLRGRGPKHGQGYDGWTVEESDINTYPYNLKQLFKDTKFKYSMIEEMAKNSVINPFDYLKCYSDYPQLEYLVKLKLYNLASQFVWFNSWSNYTLNKNGRTLEEICGLKSKNDIDFAAKNNLYANQIRAYLKIKDWKIASIDMEAIEFMEIIIRRYDINFNYDFISNEKLYLYYQSIKTQSKLKMHEFIGDYRDYIKAATYLEMNLFDTKVKTPNDFKYCHDVCIARKRELVELNRKKELKKKNNRNKKAFQKLVVKYIPLFDYQDKKYSVIVPRTPADIKKEGKELNHCVASYVDRVAEERSIILFLRKTKELETPYYTIELSPKDYSLIQCRGKGNKGSSDDIQKWIQRYFKKMKLHSTAKKTS